MLPNINQWGQWKPPQARRAEEAGTRGSRVNGGNGIGRQGEGNGAIGSVWWSSEAGKGPFVEGGISCRRRGEVDAL